MAPAISQDHHGVGFLWRMGMVDGGGASSTCGGVGGGGLLATRGGGALGAVRSLAAGAGAGAGAAGAMGPTRAASLVRRPVAGSTGESITSFDSAPLSASKNQTLARSPLRVTNTSVSARASW